VLHQKQLPLELLEWEQLMGVLGISAVLTILDLGTHCFMGPLGLVLEV